MSFYAELEVSSPFSFLRGASHAEELVVAADALGLSALGVTDWNTVAGVVRAHDAARQKQVRFLPGARLVFRDGTPDVLCYPADRDGWGRLTRVLTEGKKRAPKGECFLDRADLDYWADGWVMIAVPPPTLDASAEAALRSLAAQHRKHCYVAMTRRYRSDDGRRLRRVAELAAAVRAPVVATNDVRYHLPDRRPLHDVLTCVRLGCTVESAGHALEPHAERHLKSPAEMARLFEPWPGAVERTAEIVERCRFSLDELRYEYPDEPVPEGRTPDEHLKILTWEGAARLYPGGVPESVQEQVAKELDVLRNLGYARYFLTVQDIVSYARSRDILCQGRGSSANSAVCYCLGITAVDPTEIDLLFERFVSTERQEPPDIDVDFEHDKREEVIQYIYRRYGRERAGIAATVIHYRPKLAIREVGKVMGLAEDATAALSTQSWNAGEELWSDGHAAAAGLDPASPAVRRTIALARELVGFPRHLSQHVGGFVLTRGRLDEVVPIGPAAMKDRTFIEWDKDDIDTLGIMKVDVLALGMLTCIHKAFRLLGGMTLTDIPREDPAVYRMLQRGDSLGVFQVESRAQMNMLPRLKPERFYDLVVEVAIVRPGPIQGNMVHPYLRRRAKKEDPVYPSPSPQHGEKDELERVLSKTLGVPLFQEQAMRIAIEAAKFTPEEANGLRRAMATFRHVGTIEKFYGKMVEGMVARGYDRAFAENCFEQIKGFGTYGFPESHAASFAYLVYVSAWLKCHHPATFACALLNSQPMGFYAPAQIVRDVREHGVVVRGVDVNHSEWDCTLEPGGALRLGLRVVNGFREEWAHMLTQVRRTEGWQDFSALVLSGVPRPALASLVNADALRSLGMDRRTGLWAVRGLDEVQELPLFEETPVSLAEAALPVMSVPEHVIADYQVTGLSLKAHPLRFARPRLAMEGVLSCAEVSRAPDGTAVAVAGVVTVRQRPGSAGGVVFATVEDETGIANVVVWPSLQDRYRREMLGASLLLVRGRVQRSDGVVHVVADALVDRTEELHRLTEQAPAHAAPHGNEPPELCSTARRNPPTKRPPMHPRQERVVPRSRDFH